MAWRVQGPSMPRWATRCVWGRHRVMRMCEGGGVRAGGRVVMAGVRKEGRTLRCGRRQLLSQIWCASLPHHSFTPFLPSCAPESRTNGEGEGRMKRGGLVRCALLPLRCFPFHPALSLPVSSPVSRPLPLRPFAFHPALLPHHSLPRHSFLFRLPALASPIRDGRQQPLCRQLRLPVKHR